MNKVKVIDARMGRGKSSAAIRYMNEQKGERRFLYVTPYLDEVQRVCEKCDFEQPDDTYTTKSRRLKGHLRQGRDIAATHSLFHLLDTEALELIRKHRYSLIVDESIEVVKQLTGSAHDFKLMLGSLVKVGDDNRVIWTHDSYTGVFNDWKTLIQDGHVYMGDTAFLEVLNPDSLRAFDEVTMMTYMFEGQYQRAYLDYFGFDYEIVGIEEDAYGFRFSDKPDDPPPVDYAKLINIVRRPKLDNIGEGRYALSRSWYENRDYGDSDIKSLRNGMHRFFRYDTEGLSDTRLWTCYKEFAPMLIERKTGRYNDCFLQSAAKATNRYRCRNNVAYMVNRFANPNVTKFFYTRGIHIDANAFALSEMLQWIWRSAIRDGKPINLLIPSRRMRELLTSWMEEVSKA